MHIPNNSHLKYPYVRTFYCSLSEKCSYDHERVHIIESPLPLGPLGQITVFKNHILESIVKEIRFDVDKSTILFVFKSDCATYLLTLDLLFLDG